MAQEKETIEHPSSRLDTKSGTKDYVDYGL